MRDHFDDDHSIGRTLMWILTPFILALLYNLALVSQGQPGFIHLATATATMLAGR